jgi:hypothetical protein
MSYTLWQAVTNFATTANGVLASTFLLYCHAINCLPPRQAAGFPSSHLLLKRAVL